jgi:hypothetical protein
VALSVSVSGPRPLAGTLPYGDRTFLPEIRCGTPERLPVRQPTPTLSHFPDASLWAVLYLTKANAFCEISDITPGVC